MKARASVIAVALGLALGLGAADVTARPGAPQVATQVSPSRVDVGQMFHVTLHVQGDDPRVSNPSFAAPAGLDVLGQNLQRSSYTKMENHRLKTSTAIDVTWQVLAKTAGHYTLPGPTAMVNGKRVSGSVTSVEVGAANSGGAPKGSQSPFLFPQVPGMPKMPGWPFGNDTEPDDEPPPSSRPDLDLAQAPDPLAFVRVMLDKNDAVVGEQVTVTYYLYCRFSCEYREPADPSFPDFKRLPLDKNTKADDNTATANVGGQRFATQLLAKMAVFPLKTGSLPIGSMSVQVTGKRFGHVMDPRTSDVKNVNVTEPPLAGRPPGYVVGDVGQFSITAAVQPRQIDLGGSVAVTLRVAGTGFPPEAVHVPARKGFEWLDPEKKQTIDVQGGKIAGTRTFGYVVKIANSGAQDLGTVELPYWDPVSKKYQVASAALGNIDVSGNAPPADPNVAPLPSEPLATLPPSRKDLAPFSQEPTSEALAGRRFWALLAAPPLGFALLTAGAGAARALKRRRARGAASPKVAAERALADARAALDRNAPAEVAQQIERACHAAVNAAWGLKSRGILLADLPAELASHGAPAELAEATRELLIACDTLRFDPMAESSAKTLVASAEALVPKLLRAAKG